MLTIILAFIVLGFSLYAGCLRGSVLQDDAYIYAMKQYMIEGNFRQAWQRPWRRLTQLSFALNGKFAGQDTYSFHVTNVFIHIVNSLLTIPIFRLLGFSETWVILGGFLFLVHPLATASGAYISGRYSLLSGFFVFLSILSVLSGWPLFALPLMALALMSKEDTAGVFPLLAVLSHGLWFITFIALPIFGYIWKRKALHTLIEKTPNRMSRMEYTAIAIVEYLNRIPLWILGSGLNNKPHIEPLSRMRVLKALAVIAGLLFSAVLGSHQWLVGLAILLLSPMWIYMIVPIEDPIMDYRGYVGLLGGIVLLLTLLQPLPYLAGIALIVYFFIRAVPRVLRFRSPITFWVGCMKDGSSESPYVLAQLAAAFHMMMDLKSAEHYNRKAVERDPRQSMALMNLARIYSQQQRLPECVEVLERYTDACPAQKKGWEGLRAVYAHLKDEQNTLRCAERLAQLT